MTMVRFSETPLFQFLSAQAMEKEAGHHDYMLLHVLSFFSLGLHPLSLVTMV